MKIIIIFSFLIIFVIGCNSNTQNKGVNNFNNNYKDSTFINYYDNNVVESKGYINYQGLKFGKWDYFKKDGRIDKTIEFMIISGNQYTNQSWYYKGTKADTIKRFGNFYEMKGLKKLHKAGDTIKISIKYKPIIALNSNLLLFANNKFNKQFDNIDNISLDTIFSKEHKFKYYMVLPSKKGKYNYRGFMLEFIDDKDSVHTERKIYFDKEFFIEH